MKATEVSIRFGDDLKDDENDRPSSNVEFRQNSEAIPSSKTDEDVDTEEKGHMKPFKIRSYGKQTIPINTEKKKSPKLSAVQSQSWSRNANLRSKGTLTDLNDDVTLNGKPPVSSNQRQEVGAFRSNSTVSLYDKDKQHPVSESAAKGSVEQVGLLQYIIN